MTYFGFLFRFLVIPLAALACLIAWQKTRPADPDSAGAARVIWLAIAVQIGLAVFYTTPWDNYLVAHHVWYYNPAQVSGVLLGYVPLEEYMFFVLEAVLVGLLWQLLAPALRAETPFRPSQRLRSWSCGAGLALWCGSLLLLFVGSQPATYLGLILGWALPPILIQLAFGADILWQRRKLLAALIFIPALYLSLADSLAIRSGVWSIDAAQSLGIFIGGLPLEEGLFFFVTVMLLAFGMTLSVAKESRTRIAILKRRLPQYAAPAKPEAENP
jgi:lycopene beta-cyclase